MWFNNMKIEEHEESLKQHKEAIFEWALEVKGIENSQRIIGLHASRAALDLLCIYLIKTKRSTPGIQLNHRWFKKLDVGQKLPHFPNKVTILKKMNQLELMCENLSYGAKRNKKSILEVVGLLKEIEDKLVKQIEKEK